MENEVRYPYITAWGRYLGSFDHYIDAQKERAEADGAPQDAVYKERTTDRWVTFEEITVPLSRNYLAAKVRKLRGGTL